jgi:membrane protein DedA with SNARE-associated domain
MPFSVQDFEVFFRDISQQVPLEVFSFLGSLLEELVSPIPSYLVMGIVGSLSFARDLTPLHIISLIALGAFGKSLGALVYYYLGDKLEDRFRVFISRFLGVSAEKLESFGKRFTGAHWKDGGFIFLLRLFPLTPTTAFSVACGVVKIDVRVYMLATYAGYFLKDILYVLLGYYGSASIEKLWAEINWYKGEFEWILGFIALGVCLTLFFQSSIWKQKKQQFLVWRAKHIQE